MALLASGATLLLSAAPLAGQTIVAGKVSDPTSGAGVTGAALEVRLGGQVVGRGSSVQRGEFQIAVDVPATGVHQATVLIEHESFDSKSAPVVIQAGRPQPRFLQIEIVPRGLGACSAGGEHGGIVGHFGTPAGSSGDFPRKIANALTRNLLTRVQAEHVPEDFQPAFTACAEAKPRSFVHGGNFARLLAADVFVSGDLRPTTDGYDVYAYVSDRFDLFAPALETVNAAVKLDNPGAAELDASTLAAILVAVARSYQEDGHAAECVDVTRAAEALLGDLTPEIEAQRGRCQGGLDHRGLVRGGAP